MTARGSMPAPAGRPWLRPVGLALGAALLIAAIIVIGRQGEVIRDALAALRHPTILPAIVLPLAVLANLVLTGTMFHLLISRYGRVGVMQMQALTAATTLANYLPLRPGLFGRLAYLKAVNGIPLADSAKTVVHALLLSSASAAYLVAAALLSADRPAGILWGLVLLPLPCLALGGLARGARIWAWASGVRYLELLVWAARYHAAFSLIGSPIDATGALALACVSVIASLIPFFSNGLGIREWAVGLLAPFLTDSPMELGITAELVNRAAELVVVMLAGAPSMASLAARARRHRR